jgi:hypothetical protein
MSVSETEIRQPKLQPSVHHFDAFLTDEAHSASDEDDAVRAPRGSCPSRRKTEIAER